MRLNNTMRYTALSPTAGAANAAKGGGDAARSKSAKRVNVNGISTE